MLPVCDVVITGVGVVSPIGIGRAAFWEAIRQGRSGVAPLRRYASDGLPVRIAAEVNDFNPLAYVPHRKSLKVMCRDAQLGVAAAVLARRDAGLAPGAVDPRRCGVVLGADRICSTLESPETYRQCIVGGRFDFSRWVSHGMPTAFPLHFLRVLPNMVTSHVTISQDAQGPCNTIHQAEVSSLLAVVEAASAIRRGAADVMLAGGASSQLDPFDLARGVLLGRLSRSNGDPSEVLRPFDAGRSGQVQGEGAALLALEDRRHAEARGATPLARVLGWASVFEPPGEGRSTGRCIERAVATALAAAGLRPEDVGHVNAHGLSGRVEDCIEAGALRRAAPNVPVTAPKSYFGNLGAAGGAVEMAASVLGLVEGVIPPTLNYRRADPECPVRVVSAAMEAARPTAVLLNWTPAGQATAMVLAAAG